MKLSWWDDTAEIIDNYDLLALHRKCINVILKVSKWNPLDLISESEKVNLKM